MDERISFVSAVKGLLDQMGEEKKMSFFDHLEELRWHLVRALIVVLLFTLITFFLVDFVFDEIIFAPAKIDFWTFRTLCKIGDWINSQVLCLDNLNVKIQSRKMTGQFSMHITSSFCIGLIIAFPYVFWEIWRFISPGLKINERSISRGAVFWVTVLFVSGVLFGYYIISPLAISFLSGYQVSDFVNNEFDITSYVSTITSVVLGSGFLFQLPIIVYFLSKIGVITPQLMKSYRRHAILVIFIAGAIITPPDPFTQLIVVFPLIWLYQLSIYISARVIKKSLKQINQKKI